jgi:hypothetical protein
MYVCMYVCMYVRMYVCMYVCISAYIYIYTHTHTHTLTHSLTHSHSHTLTHTHTHTRTHTHTHTHTALIIGANIPYWFSALTMKSGAHFTCFTGTKVQILTHSSQWELLRMLWCARLAGRYSIFLLYWYKSAYTDVLLTSVGRDSRPQAFRNYGL